MSPNIQPGTIEVTSDPTGVAVVALVGEHDLESGPRLVRALADASAAATGVVVDLTETTFADSAVLHALDEAHRRASRDGRGFVLHFASSPRLQRLFEITRFLDVVPCAETRAEAVRLAARQS